MIALFSKRSGDIDLALNVKVDEFRDREGRYPVALERAALTREASADTRSRKSGHGVTDLATRWQAEAAEADWSIDRLEEVIHQAAINRVSAGTLTVGEIVETVSAMRSSWGRADVLQAICDRQRPVSQISGRRWAEVLERSADRVLDQLVDLDPADESSRRVSDGRSVWIEPTAPRYTSETVLTQEERILSWAMEAQADPPSPSITINRDGLDVFQADATAAVAGHDALVLVVGPAGAGKTRMLTAAAADLHRQGRRVFGVAPTAKAARVLERDTGMRGRHGRQTAPRMAPPRPPDQLAGIAWRWGRR